MIKKFLLNLTLAAVFILFLFTQACDDTITGDDIDNRVIPDKGVSYSEHLQPVLNLKCATSGCHDDFSKAGGVSFTSWANTTADPQVVFPYNPDNSKMVWTIEGQAGVSVMPPLNSRVAPMNENQTEGVKTWIEEGAQNN